MYSVGDTFPALNLQGVNELNDIVHVDVLVPSMWSVVYFYPKDFTFICTTEIAAMDSLKEEADVIGISGDNEFCKIAWKQSNSLIRDIDHILAADCGLKLSEKLGIVDPQENVCLRATYIIDPDGVIQHLSINALDTGRNAEEILRTLKALKAGGLTGCGWSEGDEFVG